MAQEGEPWLTFGGGYELDDFARNQVLLLTRTPAVHDLAYDEGLKSRYNARGIEDVFFVWAIVDPDDPLPAPKYRRRKEKLFVEACFVDDPSHPIGSEFDAWLQPRVREVLEDWKGLR
jgi:hypothetical protein